MLLAGGLVVEALVTPGALVLRHRCLLAGRQPLFVPVRPERVIDLAEPRLAVDVVDRARRAAFHLLAEEARGRLRTVESKLDFALGAEAAGWAREPERAAPRGHELIAGLRVAASLLDRPTHTGDRKL